MLIDVYVAPKDRKQESNAMKTVKRLVGDNTFCVGKDDFLNVRKDQNAMNYMIHQACTKVPRLQAEKHVFDTYGEATKRLGEGSFGKVYLFRKGKKKTAIKVPKSFKYKELFVELNSSECLKHVTSEENRGDFVLIKECVWPENSNPYLIMDYYRHSFEDKIKRKYTEGWEKYDLKTRIKALTDMLIITKELNVLHANEIAHRDIKSENIMITKELKPVLVDFGMTTTDGNNTKTICGTPFYLDYEVVNENGSGISSDIFSLCILFAEIFKGLNNINSVVDEMQEKGNYDLAIKGKATYLPDFGYLRVPKAFEWTWNMFKPTEDGRWLTQDVFAELFDMRKGLIKQFEKLLV